MRLKRAYPLFTKIVRSASMGAPATQDNTNSLSNDQTIGQLELIQKQNEYQSKLNDMMNDMNDQIWCRGCRLLLGGELRCENK